MFDEAQRRNADGQRPNVVLVDGDEKQIEHVEAEASRRQMNITVVLDVIHYLWTIATLLCHGADRTALDQAVAYLYKNSLNKGA